MEPFESLSMLSYSYFAATMAISLAVCEIFSIKNGATLKTGLGVVQESRSLKMAPFDTS